MEFLATEFGFLHCSNSSDQQQNQLYENLHSSYPLLRPILPLTDQKSPLRFLFKASSSHWEPESKVGDKLCQREGYIFVKFSAHENRFTFLIISGRQWTNQ